MADEETRTRRGTANISRAMLAELHTRAERAYSTAQAAKEKANETFHSITRSLITMGTAFGVGFSDGYFGEKRIGGVALDGALATALTAAGFMGLGGRNSRYVHAFGNGFLSPYMTKLGLGFGEQWALKAAVDTASGTLSDIASKFGYK